MYRLETLREAAEMLEDKIVSMCFESDPQVFVQWLRVMVASAIAGMIWISIFPGLMGKVNKVWKRKK